MNDFEYKKIVIDTSILFSFFKKESIRRKIIDKLLDLNCEIISPDYSIEELRKERYNIIKYAEILEYEFEFLMYLINKLIKIISEDNYKHMKKEANYLSPHEKDNSYFALALAHECPIWSDEKEFKNQSKVKILTTEELIKTV